MEKRQDFYANELNMERMNEVLNFVISNLTLKEILKMIREISYDMICYYDEDAKGIIYRMIDSNNNDLCYDFKNIMFKRYFCKFCYI